MLRNIFTLMLLASLTAINAAQAEEMTKGNIHPDLKLSASERFRFVTWDNTITLDDEVDASNTFTRNRTSVMGQYYPHDDFEFCAKLTNEFRNYFSPDTIDFEINEIFFDQLYARYTSRYFNATLGRQNLMFGEGLVLFDGGPLDGSRSAYFNAARLDVKPCPKGMITLFYFFQPQQEDYLPLVNDQEQALVELEEEGFGLYFDRNFEKVNLQAYYIRKNRSYENSNMCPYEFNTWGVRVGWDITPKLAFASEYADQGGEWQYITEQNAYAGYAHIDYKTGWTRHLPAALSLGVVHLSGDNPRTPSHEAWDPMFGRWPKWSESYIYTLINEGGVAYWSNYRSVYANVFFEVTPDIDFKAEYQHLTAPYTNPELGSTGNTRGDMLIGKVTYRINQYISGHALWEHFVPGNYYNINADPANWLRFELMFNVS